MSACTLSLGGRYNFEVSVWRSAFFKARQNQTIDSPAIRKRILDEPELFFKAQRQEVKPSTTTAAALLRNLDMVAAIVNRAHRRLAGAAATELDPPQHEAARQQIACIEKQLQRIDEKLLPEQETHVEPSATHHDSGAACAASEQARDRTGAGDPR